MNSPAQCDRLSSAAFLFENASGNVVVRSLRRV